MPSDPPHDPVEHAARTIVQLELAPPEEVARLVEAWRARPPGLGTVDDEDELEGFLAATLRGGLLREGQYRALLGLLGGGQRPGGRTLPTDPLLGQRFGAYVTSRKIGEGSMGKVYLAHRDDAPSERFVIKLLPSAGDPDDIARFAREGEILRSLRSPHIVQVFDAGRAGGYHYLAMEFVEGRTLQQLFEERRVFAWPSATRAVRQLALALAAAHVMGVVHRDVKPHNVLVARDGTLKLCDFGIAKLVDHEFTSRAGQILGSPAYIAPEQWGDHIVDHRADLFAVGVIYYLLLTGRTPFHGKTPAEYAARIQSGEYTPLEGIRADLPVGVRQLVQQLLERDRRHRTPTAHALVSDLDRLLRGELPDVPRLEPEGEGEPIALVGAPAYTIGAAADCHVHLDHDGAPVHLATLERTATGGVLLCPSDPVGVTVNGQTVRGEVILKDGDLLVLGPERAYRLREGNLGGHGLGALALSGESDGPFEPEDAAPAAPPREVPGVLVAALEDAGHPLAFLCCLEALDEPTSAFGLRESRATLEAIGVSGPTLERAVARARTLWRQRVAWLADRLFQATHENLGNRLEDWLAWWFEAGERVGPQVRPLGPRLQGRLLVASPEAGPPRQVELSDRERWVLGRSTEADVVLEDLSVSRRHVQLYRLVGRYAFRDLGSRQGVRIGGERRDLGLLQPGEAFELGRVRLRLAHVPQPRPPGARRPIDRVLFTALVEARSRHVVAALVELLDVDALAQRCRGAAAALGLEPGELEPILAPFLQVHRALASEALTPITGVDCGDDPAAWRAWLAQQELPLQVEPRGWG